MNDLIPINMTAIDGVVSQTVSARDLYTFLEVGKDFSPWIKGRLLKYGFVENIDYTVVNTAGSQALENVDLQNGRTTTSTAYAGAKVAIEYHLTLDVAKELAMVENNEKGRLARRYFIECERRLREKAAHQTDRERAVALIEMTQ